MLNREFLLKLKHSKELPNEDENNTCIWAKNIYTTCDNLTELKENSHKAKITLIAGNKLEELKKIHLTTKVLNYGVPTLKPGQLGSLYVSYNDKTKRFYYPYPILIETEKISNNDIREVINNGNNKNK